MMNAQQIELGLKQDVATIAARDKARQQRAQWWFTQMRRAVDAASPWQAGGTRTNQGHLQLSGRGS